MIEPQGVQWRVIALEENTAFKNMALDEAVSNAVAQNKSPPTLRFYGWNPSAVSIGYFQSLEKEVRLSECEAQGVDVVRRRTGGGAVYHDRDGEITYSIIAPEFMFPKDIIASYKLICGSIIDAFGLLDLTAEFKPINDIILNGKKVSGNAQTRRNGILLQHGTILFGLDVKKMFSVLNVSAEKISDKMIASVEERVTSVKKNSSATKDQLYDALLKGFTADKKWAFGKYSEEELARADELAKTSYSTKEWNSMR
ncbi:TPA: lipoate--protein ligase family protein [Candidatus Micrarchaeota archaeon]|nr:lipoate--protein ligase family protein [Candidatus Micrarchaeota archaeon]